MAKRKRNVPLLFWVSEQEKDMIQQKMEQLGTDNMSAYLRRMCGRAMTGCGMRPAKSYPRWPPFNSIRAASLYRARRPFLYKS